ncbi:histone H1 [Flavobacterium kingsejongi]|uniref:Histone H1 n=1 Tax=Flavobacterium kingsejongi TaxID=1678728 RepID=A0A2S1LQ95_9FLAO|nr:histone H1 [Flavobacterium kingsejongi]AWG25917.1 histone H1 [Flavobacterium kingsejongi]
MQELLGKIKAEIETFNQEVELNIEKGNKAAGTRARKSALELSKLFKDFRKLSVEESKK